MEDLTKQQLVLVALLVSFVTSIATGIVTVSLVAQAPQGVTQTIERVVQQTVSAVTPDASATDKLAAVVAAPSPSTTPAESDLLVAAVAKASKSLARISGAVPPDQGTYLGLGVVITKDGMIVASGQLVSQKYAYTAELSDGSVYPIELVASNSETGTAYFKIDQALMIAQATSTAAGKPRTFIPVSLGSTDAQVGESVAALGGETRDIISRGAVTSLISRNGSVSFIQTDTALGSYGAPLLSLDGSVIGFETDAYGSASGASFFLPSSIVSNQLKAVMESLSIAASASSAASSTPAAAPAGR